MATGGKVASKAGVHIVGKAVAKAGVRDAEKIAVKTAERTTFRKAAKKLVTRDPYRRPSGFRKGVRKKVWNNAKGPDGRVRDPQTGRVMSPNKPWDMGHKPGYEFRKHQQSARERGITRRQFLDEHNNVDHYRPELPSSNRNHKGEDHTGGYLGP